MSVVESREVSASWNPARVLYALGKIGYSTSSAILDIADNSVSNGATRVDLAINTAAVHTGKPGRPRAVIESVTIADNGVGMTEEGLHNALTLGSSPSDYGEGSLSKFGMGLKSASASMGSRLTLISRGSDRTVRTAILDHEIVKERGAYVYELRAASEDEISSLDATARGETGTMVVVSNIHEDGLESPAEIIAKLSARAGIIYFFALTSEDESARLALTVDGKAIAPLDPLFTEEAAANGNLDEADWDGLTVKYIQRRQAIQLTDDGSITAFVTITQLPHPPSVGGNGEISQAEARRRYNISAQNYGFYVFRNGRLISWADKLDGRVPQDQDLYAFRGRLEITDAADEALNINVSKDHVILSDVASSQIGPIIQEALKKSRVAWNTAKATMQRRLGDSPHDDINNELNQIEELEVGADKLDEEAAPAEERRELQSRREQTSKRNAASPEESAKLKQDGQRVQYVASLDNNQLWQRAHDADAGLIVRVNTSHRFVRDLMEAQTRNPALLKVLDVLFFALARGEFSLVYKSTEDQATAESVMDEYRERVGGELSDILRQLNVASIIDAV